MQISKLSDCEVTITPLRRLSGQFEVSVAIWHVFSLIKDQLDPPDSRVLWELAKTHWSDRPLDEGFPKPLSEFLCFGTAYPPETHSRPSYDVCVSVNGRSRNLMVHSKRVVGMLGEFSLVDTKALPVPVSPEYAFGGKEFQENPHGQGYQGKGGDLAPSIEDPQSPIESVNGKNLPAGFWPLSPISQVRRNYLGAFNHDWLTVHWPNFPPETDLKFFNMAPSQQQMMGYFVGDESGEILGMHPTLKRLPFQLPGKRARCLFKLSDREDIFSGWAESPCTPETLYLFPNEGVGALLHRCVLQVSRPDTLDLQKILVSLEPIAEPVKPQSILWGYFQDQFTNILSAAQMNESDSTAVENDIANIDN